MQQPERFVLAQEQPQLGGVVQQLFVVVGCHGDLKDVVEEVTECCCEVCVDAVKLRETTVT